MEACTPDGKILKRKNKEKNLKSQWVLEHPLSEFAKKKVRKVIFCGNRLGVLRLVHPVAKSNKKERKNSFNGYSNIPCQNLQKKKYSAATD